MRISDWSSDVCSSDLMSPAAALAFDEAVKREPAHPAAPFFAGLAMAHGGDLKGANAVWSDLLALSPANAPWRADLEKRPEVRSGGHVCGSTFSSRWSPYHVKTNRIQGQSAHTEDEYIS